MDIRNRNMLLKRTMWFILLQITTDADLLPTVSSTLSALDVIRLTSLGDFLELHRWLLLVRKGLAAGQECNLQSMMGNRVNQFGTFDLTNRSEIGKRNILSFPLHIMA